MSRAITTDSFYKLVASAGTNVALGASTTRAHKITLRGFKANGSANTGDVHVYFKDQTEYKVLATGAETVFEASAGSSYSLDQIELDADNSADGCLVLTESATIYDGP